MLRNVYLDGELGDRYGKKLKIKANTLADVFKCLHGNYSDFSQYLMECHDKNIGFMCEVQGRPIKDDRELMLFFREGDMFISPQPVGSKSGPMKIVAAIVAAVIIVSTGGFGAPAAGSAAAASGAKYAGGWAVTSAGAVSPLGAAAISATAGLAMAGIQQIMMPDPSADNDQDESYLFQGSGQTLIEGDPVPLLYGELRIPGRPVSMVIRDAGNYFYNGEAQDSVPVDSLSSDLQANEDGDTVPTDNTRPGEAGTSNPGESTSGGSQDRHQDSAAEYNLK